MKRALQCLLLAFAITLPVTAEEKLNVVYHLSEPDKSSFVLNNINIHIQGAGGTDKVNIVLVMHGPAVKAFNDIEAVDDVRTRVSGLVEQGVAFNVCGNTLKVMELSMDELLPGMVAVSQGGVTRIAELQSEGYIYIRP